jgi:hypothetical protein
VRKMKDMGRSIKCEAYARVGFLGNPSDGYYGNTIAIAIRNFGASVTLEPSDVLTFRPHSVHDPPHFASLQHLVPLPRMPRMWSSLPGGLLGIQLRVMFWVVIWCRLSEWKGKGTMEVYACSWQRARCSTPTVQLMASLCTVATSL